MARAAHRSARVLGAALSLSMIALVAMRAARRRARYRDLAGRVAIVTGGSRGLGLRIAEELGRRGMRVVICGRDQAALERAEERLAAQGIEVLARRADLGERGQAELFVERAALEWDRLDILINNAGTIHVEPADSLSLESLAESMQATFWSAVHTTSAALPHLREQKGARVVNIVSLGGRIAVPHLLGYTASKFALAGFSEGLTAELAKAGVRVTTVIPGLMRTGSFYNAEFAGDAARELGWFRVLASLPGLSMSARRAARRVVRALAEGEAVVHVGWTAALGARLHGLAPGLVVRGMRLVDRLLPRAPAVPSPSRRGRDIPAAAHRSGLLSLGERAAHEHNESPPA